ncbi:type II toxin-antitoxin system HicB family antitoxin [Allofustis seminis]|uniref:type II toxin-antitoxin system HicB family antitoxin n=1 Tax=Allofustis seminis TaxID=166939 RepID=UPI00037D95F4|nr:type II toxin-antitoxin system HicB family antitoxin [Allofustis seminis]
MKLSYPALFYYDKQVGGYFVTFPDFENSATQGDDIPDALDMASEYLGLTVASYLEEGCKVPIATNINDLSLIEDDPFKDDDELKNNSDLEKSFISMVSTDVSKYLNQNKLVKKTLTIPLWADTLGKELNLNFSQTLTDAIASKKAIEKFIFFLPPRYLNILK